MALRIQTSAVSAEGSAFSPGGELLLQGAVTGAGNPIVDILARVHNDAPWALVVSFLPAQERFKRVAEFPQVKVVVRENAQQASVTVWDKA